VLPRPTQLLGPILASVHDPKFPPAKTLKRDLRPAYRIAAGSKLRLKLLDLDHLLSIEARILSPYKYQELFQCPTTCSWQLRPEVWRREPEPNPLGNADVSLAEDCRIYLVAQPA